MGEVILIIHPHKKDLMFYYWVMRKEGASIYSEDMHSSGLQVRITLPKTPLIPARGYISSKLTHRTRHLTALLHAYEWHGITYTAYVVNKMAQAKQNCDYSKSFSIIKKKANC